MPKSVLVTCAHPDDEIFGPGGALIKWAKEGAAITTVIYTYGHLTHPHLKDEVIAAIRAKEALEADKRIGGGGIVFLGLREGRFVKDFGKARPRLEAAFMKHSPEMVLTHSPDDPHPDHRAVAKTTLAVYDAMKLKCPVYSFPVWNIVNFAAARTPRLVVDTSGAFAEKIGALKLFQSQITPFPGTILTSLLYLYTHVRDFANGVRYGHHFAEVFYKVR